ncbi:M15 family metallopeptidase [Nocardia sp. NBC_01009]|uniref:M15 family metallopeptidase n=1 Tax=Nocardia sp. NBC_01009 TaxID=2975996 RepID=UPI003866C56C|nr:M15 family metallopeptidase [Nocardia sp. NBC_01009]
MLKRGVQRNRILLGLPVAVFPALVATALALPTASATPVDERVATGSASGTEGLEPKLALAYSLAHDQAEAEGVELSITSGYRTPEQQEELWLNGLQTYGSPDEARRWVLPPSESTHVSGQAIDVGPRGGAQWLEVNGSRWGLCRIYENEWWHFELAALPGLACPPLRADASGR